MGCIDLSLSFSTAKAKESTISGMSHSPRNNSQQEWSWHTLTLWGQDARTQAEAQRKHTSDTKIVSQPRSDVPPGFFLEKKLHQAPAADLSGTWHTSVWNPPLSPRPPSVSLLSLFRPGAQLLAVLEKLFCRAHLMLSRYSALRWSGLICVNLRDLEQCISMAGTTLSSPEPVSFPPGHMSTSPRLLCSWAWLWHWAWAEVMCVTSGLKWLGSKCILSIIPFPIRWLRGEGYKEGLRGRWRHRKEEVRLLRVWWKIPARKPSLDCDMHKELTSMVSSHWEFRICLLE